MEESVWDQPFEERAFPDDLELDFQEEPGTPENFSTEEITLLELGKLSNTLSLRGHNIVLRTLPIEEELEIELLISKWANTADSGRAFVTATIAAAIESIDGKPIVDTLGPMTSAERIQRSFQYVMKKMYYPMIRYIYDEGYIPLVQKQADALEELRKK